MLPVWILLLNEDERNKLERLYNDYAKQMRAVACSILNTKEDIEDAVGDAFLKIADNMDRLENRTIDEVHAFCVVVTKNAAKDIRRKNTKRQKVFTGLDEETTPAPLDIFEQYELQEIKQYLLKLPEELQEAIWMYHLMGITVKQIARIQNVAEITVYKRIERGRSRLHEMLEANDKNAD